MREKASESWIQENLLGNCLVGTFSRYFLTCIIQDFHFQISAMAKIHSDHLASKELRSLLPHETFIMTLLLEGKWVKISGTNGSVRPDWRSDEGPEVVKLTRTLDAFQHFVLQNSEGLIITDLQGTLHW